jgi:hypothetical protein
MGFENLDQTIFEIIMRLDSQNMCTKNISRSMLKHVTYTC